MAGVDVGTVSGRLILFDDFSGVALHAAQTMENIGKQAGEVGRAFAPLSLAIAGVATASNIASRGFEKTLTQMSALAGVAEDDLAQVKERILELAPATGVGAGALAKGMATIASTLDDTKVGLEILEVAAKGSAAGMGETSDVAKALTSVINSYGAENISAARAADILTSTVKEGGAEANEMAGVLGRVVPIAAQMGIKFDEVGAFLATFTKLGVDASEAVTSLRGIMTSMLTPTSEAEEVLAEYGKSAEMLRQEVREKGLMQTMRDLMETFEGNETAAAAVFGNVRALAGIMGTAGQQAETYGKVLTNIQNSTGLLDKAFQQISDTQEMTWNQFMADIQNVAIAFGDALAPAFKSALQASKPFFDSLIAIANAFQDLPKPIQTIALGLLGMVAAISPVALGLSALIKTLHATGGALSVAYEAIVTIGTAGEASAVGVRALSVAMKGLLIGTAVGLAVTAVAIAVERFNSSLKEMEDRQNILNKASQLAGKTISDFRQAQDIIDAAEKGAAGISLDKNVPHTLSAARAWMEANSAATGLTQQLGPLSVSIEAAQQAMAGSAKATKEHVEESKSMVKALQTSHQMVRNLTAAQREEIIAGEKYGMTAENIVKNMKELYPNLRLNEAAVEMLVESWQKGTKAAEEFREESEELARKNTINLTNVKSFGTWSDMAGSYADELRNVIVATDNLTDEQRQAIDAAVLFGAKLEDVSATLKIQPQIIKRYIDAQKELFAENDRLHKSTIELTDVYANWETQAGSMQDLLAATRFEVSSLSEAQKANARAGFEMGLSIEEISKATGISIEALKMLKDGASVLKVMADGFSRLGNIAGGTLGGIIKGIGSLVSNLAMAEELSQKTGGQFGVLSVIMSKSATASEKWGAALAGAGSIAQGVMDILSKTANETNKVRGAMNGALSGASAGAAFGPIGAGIGAVAGGLFGLFRSSSNARKEQEKLREAVSNAAESFREQHNEIKNLDGVANALGISFNWAARTEAEFEDLKEQFEDFNEALADTREELGEIVGEAADLGIGLPSAIQESLLQMEDLGIITGDLADTLHGMLNEGEVDWRKMQEAAERYGIAENMLGQGFQQARITDMASQIINDFDLLKRGGADVGSVLTGMADEISNVVNESIQFGTTIPENMREWISWLIDAGMLVDDQGNAFKDMSSIKFGEPIETQFERIVNKLEELIDKLGDLPRLFGDAADAARDIEMPDLSGPRHPEAQPAMSADAAWMYGSAPDGRASFTAPIYLDGRLIAEGTVEHTADVVRSMGLVGQH